MLTRVLLTFVTCSTKHLFCTAVGQSGLIVAEVTVPRPSYGANHRSPVSIIDILADNRYFLDARLPGKEEVDSFSFAVI